MQSSLIRLFFSFIIIVFSFSASSGELEELIIRHQRGDINDFRAAKGVFKEMRREAKRQRQQFRKEEQENSYLTCKTCRDLNDLAYITTRILLKTPEVYQNETMSNEVRYLQAITLYHNEVDILPDKICEKRNFTDTHQIDPQIDDEAHIVLRSQIPFDNIDAIGIKRPNKGLTMFFARPPLIDGKAVTLVKVFIPPEGEAQVTVYKRDLRNNEVINERPPQEREVKESNDLAYQYEAPGLKVGPELEMDRNNLPKKLTILEFSNLTEFERLGLETKSEISTRRQEASLGIKWDQESLARLRVKGNGLASMEIPTSATMYDINFDGAVGFNTDGQSTIRMSIDSENMLPVTIDYAAESKYQSINVSHTRPFMDSGTVMFRISQTRDDRDQTVFDPLKSLDETSVWVQFQRQF